jgi:hypothetical protein
MIRAKEKVYIINIFKAKRKEKNKLKIIENQ